MSTTFSISDLTADVASLCNVVPFTTTTHVTSTRIAYWISQAARSYSALMRQHHVDDRELIQSATLSTVPDFALVSLPTNCGEVHDVIWHRDTRDYVLLEHAGVDDLTAQLDAGESWDAAPKWRLEGNTIAIYPTSATAETIEVYYTTHLDTSGGTVQLRVDGDKWITLEVCAQVAVAKGKDPGGFMQQKALLENDLLSRARKRAVNETHVIRDSRYRRACDAYDRRWR